MLAGEDDLLPEMRSLIQPMFSKIVECGAAPNGLLMKLAVNLISGAMMTCLAEGMNYARAQGLDLELLTSALESSSLASDFLRMKALKLASRDFTVQGALGVGRKDFDMMARAAYEAGAAVPVLELCTRLWDEAIALGLAEMDVSAVLRAYEERSLP